jgi:hypothetical protein
MQRYRIEFISPGGPYGTVTIENFGSPGNTSYRNRNLADVMKNTEELLGTQPRFPEVPIIQQFRIRSAIMGP